MTDEQEFDLVGQEPAEGEEPEEDKIVEGTEGDASLM